MISISELKSMIERIQAIARWIQKLKQEIMSKSEQNILQSYIISARSSEL